MTITVDSATGGAYEQIGALIRKHGGEDSSGLRRMIITTLGKWDVERAAAAAGCTLTDMGRLFAVLCDEYGEPEPLEVK